MLNKHLFFAFELSILATLNLIAMDSKKTEIHLWTPNSRPALYLIVNKGPEPEMTVVRGLSVHGAKNMCQTCYQEKTCNFHKYFGDLINNTKQLPEFLSDNLLTQGLIKTALNYAEVKGKVKVAFERDHENAAGIKTTKFVASIVYVDPLIFQVKATEDTPKNTQGQP